MNDPLSTSMFWVGALFAFTPIVVGGTVLYLWWRHRRAAERRPLSQTTEADG